MTGSPPCYDIIGDIHGQVGKLEALLWAMNYRVENGAWRHRSRSVLFVGDFVDRGPAQVETYRLVSAMVEAGAARAVMGNHEFNAIAWSMADGAGGHLRAHNAKNRHQHASFLDAVTGDPALHAEMIACYSICRYGSNCRPSGSSMPAGMSR